MLLRSATLTLAVLGTLAATASAGGYVGLGVSAGASMHGDLNMYSADNESGGKLLLGQRFGRLAIEASLGGTDLHMVGGAPTTHQAAALGVDLKYHFDLSGNLEAYVRGGLHRTWLGETAGEGAALDGRGHTLGGGLAYRLNLGFIGESSLWADYSHQEVSLLSDAGATAQGASRMITVGLSIGL